MADFDNPNLIDPNLISDPLDESWDQAFSHLKGKIPTDADRQDRLFSLLFPGSGDSEIWTDRDWARYTQQKSSFWTGKEAWQADDTILNFDGFILHLRRLAGLYGKKPEKAAVFSRALGLVWGGIAYDAWIPIALVKAAVGDHLFQLNEGTEGWLARHVDDTNPAHHWAAAFLTGFYFGANISIFASTARDVAQYVTGLGGTKEDISLGIIGARHGGSFRQETRNGSRKMDPYSTLFSRMQHDLMVKTDSSQNFAQ